MSSPRKTIRFHPCVVTSVSRKPIIAEQWALEDFEHHARTCKACSHPYLRYLAGLPLCNTGVDYTRRVGNYIREKSGRCYSTTPKAGLEVVVEVPPRFQCCFEVLRSIQWHISQEPLRRKYQVTIKRILRQAGSTYSSSYNYREEI